MTTAAEKAEEDLEHLGEIDRSNKWGRTTLQAGIPTAALTIITYFFALGHVDLDPGAGTDLPAEQAAAFVFIFTSFFGWLMNRKKKDAPAPMP